MTTLRSVIAHLATMIRYAGIAYIVVQVAIWHSFYAESPWRAAAPALAVAWAATAALYLRRHPPSELLTWADTAAYLALALAAQGGVPPPVRDSAFSWLHSIDDPTLALPVTNPWQFFSDYEVKLSDDDAATLQLESPEQAEIFCVVRAADQLGDFTINLRGPIVIHGESRLGRQVINEVGGYGVREPLFARVPLSEVRPATPAAPVAATGV